MPGKCAPFVLIVVAVTLLVLGCGPSTSAIQTTIAETQTAAPTRTNLPTIQPSMTPVFTDAAAAPTNTPTESPTATPANEQTGKVVRILDGDTIDVEINGQVFRVRYIGINTPEKGRPCFTEATTANVGLVYNQTVRLVKDVSETDQYNRLLRYVYEGDVFVNAALVKQGYAEAVEYPPDTTQATYLESLEAEARAAGRGCYPTGVFGGASGQIIQPTSTPLAMPSNTAIPPTPTIPVIQPTQPPAQNCDPSYPGVCIPPPPPDLDCGQIPFRNFQVLPPDPHHFDRDQDGIGCES